MDKTIRMLFHMKKKKRLALFFYSWIIVLVHVKEFGAPCAKNN